MTDTKFSIIFAISIFLFFGNIVGPLMKINYKEYTSSTQFWKDLLIPFRLLVTMTYNTILIMIKNYKSIK